MKTFRHIPVVYPEFSEDDIKQLDDWLRSELRKIDEEKLREDLRQAGCEKCLQREMQKAHKMTIKQRMRFADSILVS
jgi:hypothetical protein